MPSTFEIPNLRNGHHEGKETIAKIKRLKISLYKLQFEKIIANLYSKIYIAGTAEITCLSEFYPQKVSMSQTVNLLGYLLFWIDSGKLKLIWSVELFNAHVVVFFLWRSFLKMLCNFFSPNLLIANDVFWVSWRLSKLND